MFKQRSNTFTLDCTTSFINVVKGCPQGGVLSPLLWPLVVDKLLLTLTIHGVLAVGYANDLSIIVTFASTGL